MRRHFTFACEGARLVATLDTPPSVEPQGTGLLLVTGGNEVRSGAWAGQAQFAAAIAAAGYPVLRFDRRGCGDSEGENGEFRSSQADIAAALAAFRTEQPHLRRVVAMGNCDAASALMLAGGAGADGLILTNPWTFDGEQAKDHPPEAVRSHYRSRLRDLGAIKRLLTGQVPIRPLIHSLLSATKAAAPPTSLAQEMAAGLRAFSGPVTIAIAERDRTGLAFASTWSAPAPPIQRCPGASHSFVEADAREWLIHTALEILSAVERNGSRFE